MKYALKPNNYAATIKKKEEAPPRLLKKKKLATLSCFRCYFERPIPRGFNLTNTHTHTHTSSSNTGEY